VTRGTPVGRPQLAETLSLRRPWRWPGGLAAAYASEPGTGHACNQDACSHAPSSDRPEFCGVADGVGGGAHGEIASSVLLSHCAQAPRETVRDPDRLADWVIRADSKVAEAIARRTDQAGAATLAAAWFPSQGTAHLVNVGDCRVYRLSPRKQRYSIRRVTQDQTYASCAEAPPPNGRPNDPARMVGTGAVGVPAVVKTEIRERELLLFCSDGVHKFVPDEQIANVVTDGLSGGRSLESICGALVHAAKTNGSRDDASALLVLRRPWFAPRWAYALAAVLLVLVSVQVALAETQSVIDPTETPEAAKPARKARKPVAAPTDAARRERQRAEEEQRRRASAEARAQAAESEAAKLRAAERKAAARATARAAADRAAAAKATRARIAAEKLAADQIAARAAQEEAAAREAAAREMAALERAAREAAEREAAAREAAAKEAAREAAAREAARQAAVKEAAAREITIRRAAARLSSSADILGSRAQPSFGIVFRDCTDCPELVWLPQGEFLMGEPSANGPRRAVRIGYPLAVGKFEVTFSEWDACVAGGGCRRRPDDSGWGRGRQPVVNVSWEDAQQYVAWLSRRTRKNYRLLTEAEWEYAARAGSHVRYWWGNDAGQGDANCNGCGSKWDGRRAAPVGSFAPNPFGLHDMHGNVGEWVEDCYHDRYDDAPGDGSPWTLACNMKGDIRMLRGGTWRDPSNATRSAARASASVRYYDNRIGFRIARTE
jgi:formylglycine-generating enzyme required for sulfatase activity/serine/threonine protein phosphatase PrpC